MEEKQKKKNSAVAMSALVVCVFFVSLVVLAFASAVASDREYSESENRNLTQLPALSLMSVLDGSFMSEFESYMSDQFLFRDSAVFAKTLLSRLTGATEVNEVYIGENGRLFEVPSDYSEERVNDIISAVNSFAEKSGIENQYFLLAPNSTHILSESLPAFLSCDNQGEQISKFYSKLSLSIDVIDVVSAFEGSENKEALYFKTDHHWTSEGAYKAFSVFAKTAGIEYCEADYEKIVFSDSFYGTLSSSSGIKEAPDALSAIIPVNSAGAYVVHNLEKQEKTTSVFDLSKLETKNQYEVFFGGNFSRIVINTTNINGKRLLVFKDSFANCFIPLLTSHYEKIVIIDPRYFTGDINDVLGDTEFTDLLYLYNANTLLEDSVLSDTLRK